MYKEFSRPPKAEITFVHILLTGIVVMFFFVIPAQFIYHFQTNPAAWEKLKADITGHEYIPSASASTTQNIDIEPDTEVATLQLSDTYTGRVAGATTTATHQNVQKQTFTEKIINFFGNIDLSNRDTQLSLMGGGFVILSVVIIVYLLSTEKKPNRNATYESKFNSLNF